MPIDPKTAARVARSRGLTLPDARALAAMADSEAEAEALAAQFAPSPTDAAARFAAHAEGAIDAIDSTALDQ